MDIQKEFQHHTAIQIRFNDIDVLGHVNNAVYQHYFDLARMKYFAEVIGEDLDWNDFGLVMANISIDFFKPIKIEDKVLVRSGIELIGEKSLTMVQEIYNADTGEIKCQNRCVMVGYSAKKDSSSSIPANWSKKIFEFERKVEFKYPA